MSGWDEVRPEPFLQEEIGEQACVRCGAQAAYQWQICSDGNNYRPICAKCDIGLNRVALWFMCHPEANRLMEEYEQRVAIQDEEVGTQLDEVSVLQSSVGRGND